MDRAATVFVVDDDDAVRASLRLLLKSAGLLVETFASATEFLEHFNARRAGCLVLDVRMPGMSGLDLQRRLNAMQATIPVLFLTGHGDVAMAVEAIRCGAVDFIEKPFKSEDLLRRIHVALELDRSDRARLDARERIRLRLQLLSQREREILHGVANGKMNRVIAEDLGISQRTVEIHRCRVMQKMEAASLAQLVQMVIEAAQDL
jgi:FixJ family two-component response regulator